MKNKYIIIILSVIFGFLIWIFDAVIDYFFFYKGTFWGLMFTNLPPFEIYIRSFAIVILTLFGFIISGILEKQKKTGAIADQMGRILEDSLNEIFIFESESLKFLQVNKGAIKNIGYSRERLFEMTPLDIKPEFTLDTFTELIKPLRDGKIPGLVFETIHRRKDGSLYDVEVHLQKTAFKERGAFVAIILDITERKKAEEMLLASLKEKEILLREVHHRVKNNFQVVSSILYLQRQYTQNQDTLKNLKIVEDRIMSMALVHEMLYQAENLSKINLLDYIQALSDNLFSSFGITTDRIKIRIDIKEASLGIDEAIPIGQIINELLTNSLKYAFNENKKGEIFISLKKAGNGDKIELIYSDNGKGIPQKIDIKNTETLGLKIVANQVERQLSGSFELFRDKGTKFVISF